MTIETVEDDAQQKTSSGVGPEKAANDQSSVWLGYAIQTVLVLAIVAVSLLAYHFTVADKAAQRFALLDVGEVINLKQLAITDLATREGVTDKEREKIYDMVTSFSREIEGAVTQIQQECNCTLLVRSAVVKTGTAEDLTPLLKQRLGLDKSEGELAAAIKSNKSSAGAPAPAAPAK